MGDAADDARNREEDDAEMSYLHAVGRCTDACACQCPCRDCAQAKEG